MAQSTRCTVSKEKGRFTQDVGSKENTRQTQTEQPSDGESPLSIPWTLSVCWKPKCVRP